VNPTDDDMQGLMADLEARPLLPGSPPGSPGLGALVSLPEGPIGEVVGWLGPNPNGTRPISCRRVALIEVLEGPARDMSPYIQNRLAIEEDLKVLRSEPDANFQRKWLARIEGQVQ
jgi:hypothetical protein